MSDPPNETDVESVSVYGVILTMAETMASVAWQKMGLQPDMLTGKMGVDLDEAKVAIDLTTHLAGFIEPQLDDEDKRRIHRLIDDLRINYVTKSKESRT